MDVLAAKAVLESKLRGLQKIRAAILGKLSRLAGAAPELIANARIALGKIDAKLSALEPEAKRIAQVLADESAAADQVVLDAQAAEAARVAEIRAEVSRQLDQLTPPAQAAPGAA